VNATAPAARATRLQFDYPGVRAQDDVSFTLERGSVTALVGPNGAGKSTLMRCMAGLDTPVRGEIEIAGVDVLEHPREAHRKLGYLSDFFGVYEPLTVRQCLAHAAASHGRDPSPSSGEVARTAERLGLAPRLDVAAGTLSRGLRQRLAIAQAIIHAPELLLLDEPAAGLDPEARHALAGLFRELQAGGMTLVVSSHILAELDEYSTHMLVLRDGRLIEHRALDGSSAGEGTRLHVRLLAPDDRLHALLAAQPQATQVTIDGAAATLLWSGDAASQAALLRALVAADLAVVAFDAERLDLNASYLRTLPGSAS
jgi:ABC-2 type transport system ATP-binding protein